MECVNGCFVTAAIWIYKLRFVSCINLICCFSDFTHTHNLPVSVASLRSSSPPHLPSPPPHPPLLASTHPTLLPLSLCHISPPCPTQTQPPAISHFPVLSIPIFISFPLFRPPFSLSHVHEHSQSSFSSNPTPPPIFPPPSTPSIPLFHPHPSVQPLNPNLDYS